MFHFTNRTFRHTAPIVAALILLAAGAAPAGAATKANGQVIQFESCAKPEYPKADLDAKHQGTVALKFLVDKDGTIVDSAVAKSSGHPGLDKAAHEALAKCKFSAAPAGSSETVWVPVTYKWQLN